MSTIVTSITSHFYGVSPVTVWCFVKVVMNGGGRGWGETTINGKASEIQVEVARQANVLQGTAWDGQERIAPVSPGQLGWAVVSAIDQALWDAKARGEGRKLCELLGGQRRSTIPLYANINRGTKDRAPQSFAASAAAAVAAGFTAVKIAPFDDVTPQACASEVGRDQIRSGIDRIAAVAAETKGRARLMVDCHWRFAITQAQSVLREIAGLGVSWFECPLPEIEANRADVEHLRSIGNDLGVELAGMETGSLVEAFLPWADAYDVMMPDVKYAGGLRETLKIAEELKRRGVRVSLHNPSGSVCHAVSLHVSAAIESDLPLEIQWGETPMLFQLPVPALPLPQHGGSALPEGAGHGAALPLDKLNERAPPRNG